MEKKRTCIKCGEEFEDSYDCEICDICMAEEERMYHENGEITDKGELTWLEEL